MPRTSTSRTARNGRIALAAAAGVTIAGLATAGGASAATVANAYLVPSYVATRTMTVAPAASTMPNALNTGIAPGTRLRTTGSLVVTRAGTVLNALDVRGTILVRADNVVIQNTRVTSAGTAAIVSHGHNLLVRSTEVNGRGCHVGIMGANMSLIRDKIHGCQDGVRAGTQTLVRDSYIYGLYYATGAHNDGIQSTGGTTIVIDHNTISNPRHQTSAILLKADLAPISNVQVVGNLLDGGCYTVYAMKAKYGASGFVIRYNRFTSNALYGISYHNVPVTWLGNVSNVTGRYVRG